MYGNMNLYINRWQDTKEEFDEYQQSSQELESEMEIQLEQSEKKVKDLTSQNERLQTELDTIRVYSYVMLKCTHVTSMWKLLKTQACVN